MSWIDKELKRRVAEAAPPARLSGEGSEAVERTTQLWQTIEQANGALPEALRLPLSPTGPGPVPPGGPTFQAWLRAPNGAALGFAGDAIRYVWPQVGKRRSHNFWLRWDVERQRYVLHQRKNASSAPKFAETRFDDRRVDHMLKCLVLGQRITARSVSRRRFWLF